MAIRIPAREQSASRTVILVARSSDPPSGGLAESLHGPFTVVAQSGTSAEILRAVGASAAEVVVVEMPRGRFDVLPLLRVLREQRRDIPIVLVAGDISDDTVVEAIRLDVAGLVVNAASAEAVATCVRQVRDGCVCLDHVAVRRAVKALAERQAAARDAAKILTARELEIIRLVGAGLTNKEIGSELFITEGTIKVHLHNVFKKLRIRDRRALAEYARKTGLV